MKCIDKEGHQYEFIGFMVVADKLPENNPASPPQVVSGPISGTTLVGFPVIEVPAHFPAKIEVHQCSKCGDIKLKPAVFSRL